MLNQKVSWTKSFEPFLKGTVYIRLMRRCQNPIKLNLFIFDLSIIFLVIIEFIFKGKLMYSIMPLVGLILFISSGSHNALLKVSKNEQLSILFLIWQLTKFLICSAVILAAGARWIFEDLEFYKYPFFLGLTWIPFIEFFKYLRNKTMYLFFIRIILTIFLVFLFFKV